MYVPFLSLSISTPSRVHFYQPAKKVAHAKECVARFEGLMFLSIQRSIKNWARFARAEVGIMAHDFGDVCPTLEAFCFSEFMATAFAVYQY